MNNKIKTFFLVLLLALASSGAASAITDDNTTGINNSSQFTLNSVDSTSTHDKDNHISAISYSKSSTILPAIYDLRNLGRVTPVKDQGSLGTCWIFASFGSLESNLLPGETWDFSENNVKNILSNLYPEGFDRDYDSSGGRYTMVLAYLARWSGPVNEFDDPYNPSSGISPEGLTPVKHVQECVFLPARTGPLDNNILKEAIMKYGAVAGMMSGDDDHYNPITYSYYLDEYKLVNHAISLVGWDDNYDRNNFLTTPPGDGAFIVRDSHGTEWADEGYMYISYYDEAVGYAQPDLGYFPVYYVFMNAEPVDNYKQIYQYDPFGLIQDISSSKTGCSTAEFMNVFHATSSNPLTAASFYALGPNTNYQIYTIINHKKTLVAEGVTETAGYKTIKFNQPIPLIKGQEFKIMAKINTPGYDKPIAIEYRIPDATSKATSNPGESFIKVDGAWMDLTDPYFANNFPEANVCLKAFTSFAGNLSLKFEASKLQPMVGELLKLTINAINTGPDNSIGTQVNYQLPTGLKLKSYDASMGIYNPITGIWTIGDLPFGETASLVIYSIVNDPGYYINQATITSSTYNSNPENTINVIIHAVKPSENAETSSEENIVGMQNTGITTFPIILATLLLIIGITTGRKK